MEWGNLKMIAENVPVRPQDSVCTCERSKSSTLLRTPHGEDGWHVCCLGCGTQWVEWKTK